jgi:hypothetical protein
VTVAETLLVYVGAPLLVVIVLAALTFLPGGRKKPRWKSGQPWAHEPIWYEPHPESMGGHGASADGHAAIGTGATSARALTAGSSAGQAHPVPGGPLGGARGTW